MASENVKIKIVETNETSPLGAGASSDIAYVPGLVGADTKSEYLNRPVLCNTVAEFKTFFGETPYEFESDITHDYISVKSGDVDASYLYALELLNNGMSVYYEAIEMDTTEIDAQIAELEKEISGISGLMAALVACINSEEYQGAQSEEDKQAMISAVYTNAGVTFTDVATALADAARYEQVTKEITDLTESKNSDKITYLYNTLGSRLMTLEDKDEYSVKYITTGGYPVFKDSSSALASTLATTAYNRGDAVAIIDHTYNRNLTLDPTNANSVFSKVNAFAWGDAGAFATMFTPYATYTLPAYGSTHIMPASFGYLMCVASAIKTSPNWLAMAGVARGVVPGLQQIESKQLLSNLIAEEYQPKFGGTSVNAITNIKPYGQTIWGNRTLETVADKGTTALNFLNTRNMISDIKKVAHSTAKTLMFEQDSDALWLKFKGGLIPLLEQLKTGSGISDYKIIKATTNSQGQPLTRGELAAVIRVYPLYAVEYFDITVAISDPE